MGKIGNNEHKSQVGARAPTCNFSQLFLIILIMPLEMIRIIENNQRNIHVSLGVNPQLWTCANVPYFSLTVRKKLDKFLFMISLH